MYDFCIIGGGVIGCAVARELTRYKASVVVVEACSDVCTGTSGANSAIVHSGYDPAPGTLMARYNLRGSKMFRAYAAALDVPYKATGSLTVAVDAEETETLKTLLARGRANGVTGLKLLGREEAAALEPRLADGVVAALYAPSAAIINPFELTFALRENAEANGAEFRFGFTFSGAESTSEGIQLRSAEGDSLSAKTVINCAGNNGGEVARKFGELVYLSHRAGEYRLFDKIPFVRLPVFQTPSSKGKGVLVAPTTDGNFFIGPTAVDTARPSAFFRREAFDELARLAAKSVKGIPYDKQITSFVGVRALPPSGDFIIGPSKVNPRVYNVIGICSPGLSSVPAIAAAVARSFGLESRADFNPLRKRIPRLAGGSQAFRNALIAADPAYGNVVCRCETVSEAEVKEAIARGARTVDGVKKRLRAGMGRCQGGFCEANVINILARELGLPADKVEKKERGSYILAKEDV